MFGGIEPQGVLSLPSLPAPTMAIIMPFKGMFTLRVVPHKATKQQKTPFAVFFCCNDIEPSGSVKLLRNGARSNIVQSCR